MVANKSSNPILHDDALSDMKGGNHERKSTSKRFGDDRLLRPPRHVRWVRPQYRDVRSGSTMRQRCSPVKEAPLS
jgi:hypothetical protein